MLSYSHILNKINDNYKEIEDLDHFKIDQEKIMDAVFKIRILFFPEYYETDLKADELLEEVGQTFDEEIARIDMDHEATTKAFLERLPDVQEKLYKDLTALYNGDPSAKTYTEIITSFPGFQAVFMYRLAHELYELDVPIIPRMIAEYAHEKTGIDINPGAKIGEYFCIDHGTGIVIGETAVVGDHVRMYHGVTLGVRSFRKDEEGNLLKGGKRHPNIGDHVIIYANSIILGGDTFIESGTAVPAGSVILHTPETFL